MASLTDILKRRKEKKRLNKNPEEVLLEEINRINGELENLKKKLEDTEYELELDGSDFNHVKGDKGDKGEQGESIVGPRGPRGDKGESIVGPPGKNADEEKIEKNVLTKIPKPKDGKDGKSIKGDKGDKGNMPRHQTRNGFIRFEQKNGKWGKWIKIKADKPRKGGGGDLMKNYDLTSECNGKTKVFTIPANREIIGVFSTQFPINYRPLIDWTGSGTTTLTLTDEVGAPKSGQTLWILFIK